MRIFPNRKAGVRDAPKGASHARAGSRPADAHAAPADDSPGRDAPRGADGWTARFARFVRNTAVRPPRASTAPVLSLVTLVLVFGGYVAIDRMCKNDAVCRAHGASPGTSASIPASSAAADLVALTGDLSTPIVPPLAYPFYLIEENRPLVAEDEEPDIVPRANRTVERTAPVYARATAKSKPRGAPAVRPCSIRTEFGCEPPARVGLIRTVRLPGGTHKAHGIRRVGTRVALVRRPSAAMIGKLYDKH